MLGGGWENKNNKGRMAEGDQEGEFGTDMEAKAEEADSQVRCLILTRLRCRRRARCQKLARPTLELHVTWLDVEYQRSACKCVL